MLCLAKYEMESSGGRAAAPRSPLVEIGTRMLSQDANKCQLSSNVDPVLELYERGATAHVGRHMDQLVANCDDVKFAA